MNTSTDKLFAIPKGYDAWVAATLVMFCAFFFLVVYGGASFIGEIVSWRYELSFSFENSLPFIPLASIVYLSMMVMLVLAPFILRCPDEIIPLFVVLITETAIAAIFFILFPIDTGFPSREAYGITGAIFNFADIVNMKRNYFPSLHVSFAFTAAFFYSEKSGNLFQLIFTFWALAISVSTILIHEHYLVDVLAGFILAVVCWKFIGQWARKDKVLKAFKVELYCLYNFLLFGKRHPRYWLIALGLYKKSIPHFKKDRIFRTGFCFLQLVDDILDGDRKCEGEPLEFINKLVEVIEKNSFDQSDLMQLASTFRNDLYAKGGDKSLSDMLELIKVMQQDRQRVLSKKLLNGDQLKQHHRKIFSLSIDLMLLAGDSNIRSSQLPELIDAFAWCSTVRDLKEDLQAGLVNIPKNIINNAIGEKSTNESKELDYEELITTDSVLNWLKAERVTVIGLLDITDQKLIDLKSVEGVRILHLFSKSIRNYDRRKFPKYYPEANEIT